MYLAGVSVRRVVDITEALWGTKVLPRTISNLNKKAYEHEVFSDAKYQRCTVHFYRIVFSVTPKNKMKEVSMMLNAIHAQESKEAAKEKAEQVILKQLVHSHTRIVL